MHHIVTHKMDRHVIQILDQIVILKLLVIVQLHKDYMQPVELIVYLKMVKLVFKIKGNSVIQLTIMLGAIFKIKVKVVLPRMDIIVSI